MNTKLPINDAVNSALRNRLICVAVIENADDAVPLAEALLAGGLPVIEVTFRTDAAAESIARIRQRVPQMIVGAGTVLNAEQLLRAIAAGAHFAVSPGLNEPLIATAAQEGVAFFPGVMTPTEIGRALEMNHRHLKFFPSEAAGGIPMLKALAGPFAHTGVKFIPTGGVTAANLAEYLSLPTVAAVGGSWMAERKLVAEHNWVKITALTSEAMQTIGRLEA